MTDKPRTKICILSREGERELFSVEERSSGDLLIFMRHAKNLHDGESREISGEVPHSSREVKSQKYSIHLSSSSKYINIIKQTILYSDGDPEVSWNATKALKEGRIAHIYSRRPVNLGPKKFEPNASRTLQKFVVDNYDSSKFILFYSVLVAETSDHFVGEQFRGISVKKFPFRNFCIYLMISYYPGRAMQFGRLVHSITFKKGELPIQIEALMEGHDRGCDVAGAYAMHIRAASEFKTATIEEMRNGSGHGSFSEALTAEIMISKGHAHSREYREAIKRFSDNRSQKRSVF